MAFLSTEELGKLLSSANCIQPYRSERLQEAAYELALGDQVYMTDSKDGKREVLGGNNTQIEIKPGQFALLLTEEIVKIPDDKLAFISIKFSQKIKGLVNVSGFHVDPGFHGKIIFSVYNAGPVSIMMDKGKPYFMIWFSQLTSSVTKLYDGTHQAQGEISAELIEKLKGELASPSSLLKLVKELDNKLEKETGNVVNKVDVQIKDLDSKFEREVDKIGNKVDTQVDKLIAKKEYNKWILQAIAVLLLGLWIKSCTDNNELKKGYEYGVNKRTVREEIEAINIDSLVSKKVDSIVSIKNIVDSSK